MQKDVMGYDGAVNGLKILHGLAVESETLSGPQTGCPPQPQVEADIESAVQRATEVIGSREEAMRWLGTPVRALDYATPISRLNDPPGRERVFAVLTNLEHGVL